MDGERPLHMIPLIEQLGLGDRVWGLASGELTPDGKPMGPKKICELLSEEGIEVPYRNLSKWIRTQREKVKEDVREMLTAHLREKLPGDLDALELIEQTSLENAKKQVSFISHDISVNKKVHKHFVDNWVLAIVDAMENEKILRGLVAEIVRQVGDWITERIDWMKTQRDERKVALSAIDMKLRYAAQLHGAGSGNILIYGQGEGPADPSPKDTEQTKDAGEETEKKGEKKEAGNVVTFGRR
jgi:hypothetical protein